MAITKNIVDMMGGNIGIQTEQGKGTEFIVRLPLRIQSKHHRVEKIPALEGLKALVIDDDFNTCDSVTKMLARLECVRNGHFLVRRRFFVQGSL